MASYSPLYNASGLITSYYSSPEAPRTTYTKKPTKTAATSNTTSAPSAEDDLAAWMYANIPGYGGSNPSSVPRSFTSNVGQFPSYNPDQFQIPQINVPQVNAPQIDSSFPQYSLPEPPAPAPLSQSNPQLDALTGQSLRNIGSGLRGELTSDVIQQITQRGAERGLSVGSNSPNAGAAMLRALGLTSLDIQQAAEKNLQPYQERSAAVNLANIGEQGSNYRAILDATSAMQRAQLSESGQNQRLSVSEQGDTQRALIAAQSAMQQLAAKGQTDLALALINANSDQQRQILAGAQAMEQLRLSESGRIAQLSAQIKADLQRQILQGQQALQQIQAQGQNQLNNTIVGGQFQLASGQQSGQNQLASERQAGQNQLDAILARYSLGGATAIS